MKITRRASRLRSRWPVDRRSNYAKCIGEITVSLYVTFDIASRPQAYSKFTISGNRYSKLSDPSIMILFHFYFGTVILSECQPSERVLSATALQRSRPCRLSMSQLFISRACTRVMPLRFVVLRAKAECMRTCPRRKVDAARFCTRRRLPCETRLLRSNANLRSGTK